MSAQQTPGPRQRINDKHVIGGNWTEFEVETRDRACQHVVSRTTIRSSADGLFVDVAIEEYTGETRRAKYTSVRLEEEAARRLYAVLTVKFGGAA